MSRQRHFFNLHLLDSKNMDTRCLSLFAVEVFSCFSTLSPKIPLFSFSVPKNFQNFFRLVRKHMRSDGVSGFFDGGGGGDEGGVGDGA